MPKSRAKKILLIALMIASALVLVVRLNPLVFNESFFSHAYCIQMIGLALEGYAGENGGSYPVHTNGFGDALLLLTNWAPASILLGGPGYPFKGEVTREILEENCGRIYVMGLTEDSPNELALVFDRVATPGDHKHLLSRVRAPLGREVWTQGGMKFIPERDWPAYASNQVELLVKSGILRAEAEGYYRGTY